MSRAEKLVPAEITGPAIATAITCAPQDAGPTHNMHEVPNLLMSTTKAKAKPTYKPPRVQQHDDVPKPAPVPIIPKHGHDAVHNPAQHTIPTAPKSKSWPNLSGGLPRTKLVKHGAGWTIFDN
ncbi:hypothetical protein FRC07_002675, partial [Ceratobasidium sp. 392]